MGRINSTQPNYLSHNLEVLSNYGLKSRPQFPILGGMAWLLGGLVFVAVGLMLHRILWSGGPGRARVNGFANLPKDLQAVYQPLAQEIEAHATILGITLNDAFGEREAKRHEMAWRVVRLAVGEWERLAELLVGLQNVLNKFAPNTDAIVPVRRVATDHFKSRPMMDNLGMYEFLDQVLFSSKRRFSLQLRFLTRATLMLSKDFRHACREGERGLDATDELWTRLDYYFHDFDLIAKESLLAFRTLLACQTPEAAQELSTDLQVLLERGMRVSISPSDQ